MFKKRKQSSNIRKRSQLPQPQPQPQQDYDDDDRYDPSIISHSNDDLIHKDISEEEEERLVISSRSSSSGISMSSKKLKKKNEKSRSNVSSYSNGNVMHEYKTDANNHHQRFLTGKDLATAHSEYTKDETKYDISKKNLSAASTNTNKTRNTLLAGPLRAPSFVRTTCVFDYQPNVCKDYKETGFCGFGDSCIYLHDRSDNVQGWQLEQEWEQKKKLEEERKEKQMNQFLKKASRQNNQDDDISDDDIAAGTTTFNDGLPFACYICRQPFTEPVVTTCKHYFCEKCIMLNFQERQNPACPICKKDTNGVFNYPQKLLSKRRRLNCKDWIEFATKVGDHC